MEERRATAVGRGGGAEGRVRRGLGGAAHLARLCLVLGSELFRQRDEDVKQMLLDGPRMSRAGASQVRSGQVRSGQIRSSQVESSGAESSRVEPSREMSQE